MLISLSFIIFLFNATDSLGKSEEGVVNNANKLYNEGKYDEALRGYNVAEEMSPESDVVSFNKGAALYKKYGFKEALKSFSKVLSKHNPGLESKATYNIGNAKYKLGKAVSGEKREDATNLYKEDLDYYKRTIELDQEDQDAKFNYEFVERELKALEEKKEEQEQQQDQDQDKQDKDKQQSQSQKGQDKQEDQKEREEEDSGAGSQEREEDDEEEESQLEDFQEDSEGADQEDQESEGGQKDEPQEGEMSKEEAQMLLDAYGQQEEPETKDKKRAQYDVLKDW
jgi:Ca-activated chloride channel family protein